MALLPPTVQASPAMQNVDAPPTTQEVSSVPQAQTADPQANQISQAMRMKSSAFPGGILATPIRRKELGQEFSPELIKPYTKVNAVRNPSKKKRKRGKSLILTKTPVKEKLESR